MEIEEALDVMATYVAAMTVTSAIDDGKIAWEDYAEIGEHHWAQIVHRIAQRGYAVLADHHSREAFKMLAALAADEPT